MMQALYNRVRIETGMTLAQDAIEHAVRRRMRDTGNVELKAYALRALSDEQELSALIDQVVVPETWFFRDTEAFSAATAFAARQIHKGRRPVRVLSVPCATGEEPYSMAIALSEAGIAPGEVIIDAIDVSRGAIERARRGVYHRNAFRTSNLTFRDIYFSRLDHDSHGHASYELRKEIRTAVRFRCANLLTVERESTAEQYDIIFCRNLLIYFDEAGQRNAAAKLRALLRDDGLLLSGYAETNAFMQHGFAAAPFPKAFALTKAATAMTAMTAATASAPSIPPVGNARKRSSLPPVAARKPRVAGAIHAPPPAKPHAGLEENLRRARETADAGNHLEAERLYKQCLQLAPDCAEAYFMLGLFLEQQHKATAAAEHLRRAVYLDPDHYEALCHLALLAEQDGDAAAARQLRHRAERVFQRQPGMRGKP